MPSTSRMRRMAMPERLQRQRTRGWTKPANTICVTRPSRWGNEFIVGIHGTAEECVQLFTEKYTHDQDYQTCLRRELAGKNLACWCTVGAPCHADVQLHWANSL